MPLRRRVAWVAAAAVGVAVVLAAVVCYVEVRGQLLGQVDVALNYQEIAIQHGDIQSLRAVPGIPANLGGPAPYAQLVLASGQAAHTGDLPLPIDSHTREVASGHAGAYITDIHVNGSHLRELTFPVSAQGGAPAALQLARPLDGVDRILSHLRLILALLIVGGMALAAALGRLAARRVLAPLGEVAQTAEHISETEDLTSRLRVHADDEVGQLATRFNAMIERLQRSRSALDESVQAQRQLVADASHELRTPVTSLRTN
ncbi:MAG TPA: HAMP domain-containing protein, partial [Solirubrobacteraceae bacterium]